MGKPDQPVLRALLVADQASTSGIAWGKYDERTDKLTNKGFDVKQCTYVHRDAFILQATQLAGGRICDVAFVYEDHSDLYFGRGDTSVKTILGMGKGLGVWLDALDRAKHPESMRFSVTAKQWRKAVLSLPGNTSGEKAKEEAVLFVQRKYGQEVNHNAAEAICMMEWAHMVIPRQLAAGRVQKGFAW